MESNNQKLLSICIPTYNRDWCLKDLINVLKEQITGGLEKYVEVIFSDNCSVDNTRKLILEYAKENSYVKYYKNEENIGFGRNYLKSASYSSGVFTWVLGDDDLPADGAVKELIDVIQKRVEYDIILFNFIQKDISMKKTIRDFTALSGKTLEFKLSDDSEFVKYLEDAQYSSVLFSYISSYIFKTSSFSQASVKEKYKNHPFTHLFYLWAARKNRLNLFYLNKSLLFNRSGNDRISDNLYDVINVFLSGVEDLCDEFFLDNKILYNSVANVSKIFDGACSQKTILKSVKRLDKARFSNLISKVKKLNYPKIFILKMYLKRFYYHIFLP